MKLIGELKKKVEKAGNLTEAKEEIAHAGMELTDEEMATIAGGKMLSPSARTPEAMEAKRKKEQDVREMIAEWKKAVPARRDELSRILLSPEYLRIGREIDRSFYLNELPPFAP